MAKSEIVWSLCMSISIHKIIIKNYPKSVKVVGIRKFELEFQIYLYQLGDFGLVTSDISASVSTSVKWSVWRR